MHVNDQQRMTSTKIYFLENNGFYVHVLDKEG